MPILRVCGEETEIGDLTVIELWEKHAVLSYALSHSILTYGEDYEHPIVDMYFAAAQLVLTEIRSRHEAYRR